MPNEIYDSFEEGNTLYALIWRKTDDKVYDVVAGSGTFDTYTDADIGDYDLPLSNIVDSNYYTVDFPAGIAEGIYRVQIFLQAAGSPHEDNDREIAHGEINWDGTDEITISTVTVDVGDVISDISDLDTKIDLVLTELQRVENVYDETEKAAEVVIIKNL